MTISRKLRVIFGVGVGIAMLMPDSLPATPVDRAILQKIGPRIKNPGRTKKQMIEIGRKLFFEETFDGNGRTCGTCHPATNNFTIDPKFISNLPNSDPLFVAEFNPDLAELEKPELMRQFGLILENLDGFDRPGVMRSVPHNLALPTSIKSDLAGKGHALGWSGDGSPGDGTLRLFSLGAIVQHFPRTLNREAGVDFRLPTDFELDAMEAFMLSVGRQEDIDLAAITFSDSMVEDGKDLFLNGTNRRCAGCHANAGAANASGINRNFDTGTRTLLIDALAPPDGGFGDQAQGGVAGFGDGTMNTPPLIEAADTPPFFHNHSAATLEEAITFYTSDNFRSSPAGGGDAFDLDSEDIKAIGAMLRTLNAMENIRNSNVLSEVAQRSVPRLAEEQIEEVVAETEDAIEVLSDVLPDGLYPAAIAKLEQALILELEALKTTPPPRRNALLREASALKREASAMMVID